MYKYLSISENVRLCFTIVDFIKFESKLNSFVLERHMSFEYQKPIKPF